MYLSKPTIIQKRAIDVTPHNHALWCSVGGVAPFANTIEYREWGEDGKEIFFGLDTHNGFSAEPDELMAVVEEQPDVSPELLAEWIKTDADKMAQRPVLTVSCPHCGGTGGGAQMSNPTQAEIDAVKPAIITAIHECANLDDHWGGVARAAIAALDTNRGDCVPICKLKARIEELWGGVVPNPVQSLVAWISRRGWLDGSGKAP